MSSKKRIERRRELRPQGRNYEQVARMLLERISHAPMVLVCARCRGEHVLADVSLTIHCTCGAVTRYALFGLFHAWSSLLWMSMLTLRRYNVPGDTTPLRDTALTFARVVDEPLVNPQQPMDLRVHLWRARSVR